MAVYKISSSQFSLVERANFVGDENRLFYTVDGTNVNFYLSDGETEGGFPVAIGGGPSSDNQVLSLNGTNLTISGGNTVDLSSIDTTVDLTGYATEEFVNTAISNVIGGAGTALDTLNELAAAIGNDPNFAVTISNELADKVGFADFETQFDINLATVTTDEVAEGVVNLYYTDARVQDVINNNTNNYITAADIPTNVSAFTNDAGYLTSVDVSGNETDPVFTASVAAGITSTQVTNWDTAFSWGDHSVQGYLTSFTETDPIFSASVASGITGTDVSNWNTAFAWGDHSTQGYITAGDVSGNETDTLDSVTTRGATTTNAIATGAITAPQITFDNATENGGVLTWNETVETLNLTMKHGVVQQIGEEMYYPIVANETGATILNGTPVMAAGPSSLGDFTKVVPAIANGTIPSTLYMGLVTEDIPHNTTGRVTYFGKVNDINTSAYPYGTLLYVSSTVPGGFTNTPPVAPGYTIPVGLVTKSGIGDGRIFVRHETTPLALQVSYDNTVSLLEATNVQNAIDELQIQKADINAIQSSLALYATTAASDVTGYNRLVTTTNDPDYDTIPADIPTGPITGTGQLVGQLVSDPGVIIGTPGIINITTAGNIRKVAAKNDWAQFYYTVSKRDDFGGETLLATSSDTGPVSAGIDVPTDYHQFIASAILVNSTWTATDRVVIKYYADALNGTASEYEFQFGGESPVRTNFPVPVSVIAGELVGTNITLDTTNFDGVLSATDNTLQEALDTIDDHVHNMYLNVAGDTGSTTANTPTDTISVTGTTNQIVTAATADTLNIKIADNPILPGLESLTLPIGSTSERPTSPVEGMIRYNTTLSAVEGYINGTWSYVLSAQSFAASLGVVQARRTTTYTATATATDPADYIEFDASDAESDALRISHDDIDRSKITVLETGYYLVGYNAGLFVNDNVAEVTIQNEINGTTVIESTQFTVGPSNDVAVLAPLAIVYLTAGDYVQTRIIVSNGDNCQVSANSTFTITSLTGAKGDDGISFVWKGDWNSATQYVENDVVRYENVVYVATANNVNDIPSVSTNWNVMIEAPPSVTTPTYTTRTVTTATHTITADDYYVGVNFAGECTITLGTATSGRTIVIKDESGTASTNNIILSGTVDGGTDKRIGIDNGSLTLIYNNGWRII